MKETKGARFYEMRRTKKDSRRRRRRRWDEGEMVGMKVGTSQENGEKSGSGSGMGWMFLLGFHVRSYLPFDSVCLRLISGGNRVVGNV